MTWIQFSSVKRTAEYYYFISRVLLRILYLMPFSIVSVVQLQSSNPRISIHKLFCQGEFTKPIILPLLISLHFASTTRVWGEPGFLASKILF